MPHVTFSRSNFTFACFLTFHVMQPQFANCFFFDPDTLIPLFRQARNFLTFLPRTSHFLMNLHFGSLKLTPVSVVGNPFSNWKKLISDTVIQTNLNGFIFLFNFFHQSDPIASNSTRKLKDKIFFQFFKYQKPGSDEFTVLSTDTRDG